MSETQPKIEKLEEVQGEFSPKLPKALVEREEIAAPKKQKQHETSRQSERQEAPAATARDLPPSGSLRRRATPQPASQPPKEQAPEPSAEPPKATAAATIKPADLPPTTPLRVLRRQAAIERGEQPESPEEEILPMPEELAKKPDPSRAREMPPTISLRELRKQREQEAREQEAVRVNAAGAQDKAQAPVKSNTNNASPTLPPASVKEKRDALKEDHRTQAQNREIRVDLSAARSLSSLICALAIQPGLGAEITQQERRDGIYGLVKKSHELTDFICKKINNDKPIPNYLHGSILQEASRHIANQWRTLKTGDMNDIDVSTAELIASEVFDHENPLLETFAYEAASQTARYELDDVERAELELQVSAMSAMTRLRSAVLAMRIGGLIEGYGEQIEALREKYAMTPFLFNKKNESEIVVDLVNAAIRIAEKNKIHTNDEAATLQWNTSMIYRATDLVKSEYEMIVERLIRVSFNDINLYEQEINANSANYNTVMRNIEKRAEDNFNMISKNARAIMTRSLFMANKEDKRTEDSAIQDKDNQRDIP